MPATLWLPLLYRLHFIKLLPSGPFPDSDINKEGASPLFGNLFSFLQI